MNKHNLTPNFIIAGAAKSGTSSLAYYLSSSPDVFIPKRKELHYFSKEGYLSNLKGPGDEVNLQFCCNSWEQYLKEYESAGNALFRGDASPSYMNYESVAQKIKEKLGGVKVVFILRNPVDRAYSNYLHMVRDGREKLSFYDALLAEEERKNLEWTEFWQYVSGGLYYKALAEYLDVFGKENVKILLFEEFIQNPDQAVKEVAAFIGVNPNTLNISNIVVNKSGIPKFGGVGKFVYKDSLFKRLVKRVSTPRFRMMIKNKMDSWLLSKESPDQKSINYIEEKVLVDIQKTEELLGRKTGWLKL